MDLRQAEVWRRQFAFFGRQFAFFGRPRGRYSGSFCVSFFSPICETGAFVVSNSDDDLPELDEDTVFARFTTLLDRGDELKRMYSNTTDDMPSFSGILIAVKMSTPVDAICVASLT